MKLLNFTIIKLAICLIIGIIISPFLNLSTSLILFFSSGLMLVLLISLIITRNQMYKTLGFGIITYLTMICIGILVVKIHDQTKFITHYSQKILIENDSSKLVTFRVHEVLKPSAYHDKYIVNVFSIDNKNVTGKLLMNIRREINTLPLDVDAILMVSTPFSKINAPLNPYQFDYKTYLSKRYIDHQVFVSTNQLFPISSEVHTIYGYASRIRQKIDEKLKTYNFNKDELAIVDALLLGQRKDISVDTYNNYVNAGAIHILAVSGLHVGIILYMLNKLFRPIERLRKGNYIKMAILVILLWCFAIIAGLSPSVTRAVTMFTVVAIAINLKRSNNIFNTLAISMFVLLLLKPMFLYDVGFQMSYTAVLSIVSIQPFLVSLWTPNSKLVSYFWNLFSVTTAAQIGVMPISLYYFHQFPGLFFLSNLVILPFLGFILGFGIIVIILALLDILPHFVADIYGFFISLMNNFVAWISQQESFVFKNISFGIIFVIVSYIIIISVFSYFKKPNYQRLVFVLVAVLLLQVSLLFHKNQMQTNEFVIFQKSRFTLIGIKQGERLNVIDNLDSVTKERDNNIRNYKVGLAIKIIHDAELQSVYNLKNEKLLIIDSLGIYNVKSFVPDYLLLRNSPKINLNRMIDSLQPKLIIADGSNYKSYLQRWKETCEEQKIPYHQTNEKGAFVLKY